MGSTGHSFSSREQGRAAQRLHADLIDARSPTIPTYSARATSKSHAHAECSSHAHHHDHGLNQKQARRQSRADRRRKRLGKPLVSERLVVVLNAVAHELAVKYLLSDANQAQRAEDE